LVIFLRKFLIVNLFNKFISRYSGYIGDKLIVLFEISLIIKIINFIYNSLVHIAHQVIYFQGGKIMMQEVKESVLEVLQAVFPITLAIVLILLVFIGTNLSHLLSFLTSALLVTLGMFFFLIGVKVGMLPIGEAIGADLPKHSSLAFITIVVFLLSFLTTIAEPDVRVLSGIIDLVSQGTINGSTLIISIALGVGFFVATSVLRIIYGTPIKYLFAVSYLIIIVLSFFVPGEYQAISFDAGSVTTGPITVPVIMAIGIGTASVLENKSELSDGFGLMGLASIGPILSIMILGVLIS
jgi:hypothetical protein